MSEKIIPGLQKLIQAEKIARARARPEPIYSHPSELQSRNLVLKEDRERYKSPYLSDVGLLKWKE